jgi:catechol 2,3-dioxygenase-like lactoylglutathione lyase family enzyme
MTTIAGLHHVTAIAIDPQANIEFCTKVLGLRLIKETVNFDDPSTYHFYYGDTAGRPGTILTLSHRHERPRAQRNRYGRHHDVRRPGKFTRTLDDAAD